MKSNSLSGAIAACALALFACAENDDRVIVDPVQDSTLLVVNESDFAIEEIYITDLGSPTWGPNLLAGDVLLPFEDILLTDILCDAYDVLIVAEDGLVCELGGISLCFDGATWILTNDTCDLFR